jgi:hypothetical protein
LKGKFVKLSVIDMALLWARMSGTYGAKWTQQFGTDSNGPQAKLWRDGLQDIDRQQLLAALDADVKRGSAFVPTLPEFRALCLDIPSVFSVRQEIDAQARAISRNAERPRMTPFARLAAQLIDWHNYRQASDRDCDAMFKRAYDGAREHVLNGGDLPPEPVALIEQAKPANAPKPPKRWETPPPLDRDAALARFKQMDEDARNAARSSRAAINGLAAIAERLGTPPSKCGPRMEDIRAACAAMEVGPMDMIEHHIRSKEGRDMVVESLRRIASEQGINPPNIRDE